MEAALTASMLVRRWLARRTRRTGLAPWIELAFLNTVEGLCCCCLLQGTIEMGVQSCASARTKEKKVEHQVEDVAVCAEEPNKRTPYVTAIAVTSHGRQYGSMTFNTPPPPTRSARLG
jgi:hypothetical protein